MTAVSYILVLINSAALRTKVFDVASVREAGVGLHCVTFLR